MEKQQIESFMAANSKFFASEDQQTVRNFLEKADAAKANAILATSFKNPTVILIIAIFIGEYGVDRFMLGQTGLGVAKLFTCGGCGIWWLIDIFTAYKRTYEYNMDKLMSL